MCWGDNYGGQLGNGHDHDTTPIFPVPIAVAGGHRFTEIAAYANHTCGLTEEKEIWCWGANDSGESGQDPSAASLLNIPVRVILP